MFSEESNEDIAQAYREINAFEPTRRIHRSVIEKMELPWYMFSARSAGKYRWDIFILIAALYNCIISPYLGTFEPSEANSIGFTVIGVLIDAVFIVDLVMSFFTTYIEEYGREISNLKRIREKYLQGKFIIDAVAALPIETITVLFLQRGTLLYVLGLLRILRLSRLGKIFFYLRVKVEVKMTLRMIQLVGFLFVYIHMMACSWYFLVKQDKSWDVLVYTVYKDGSIYDESQVTQYWMIYYVGLYTLLGVEIYPTNISEYVFMSTTVLIGAMIISVILGDMVVLLTAMSQDTEHYNIHYDKINEVMNNLRLPQPLQNKVLAFYIASFYSLKKHTDYRKLLGYLTRGLQQKVIQNTYQSFFSTSLVLQQNTEAWKFIILAFKDVFYKPEQAIIDQFSYGKTMSFIIKGRCFVSVLDNREAVHGVRELGEGDFFGEVALLYNTSRTASVSSTAYTYTLQLSERFFHYFCQQNPEWRRSLIQHCATYRDPYREYMFSLLRQIPYFAGLSEVDTQQILYAARPQFYNTNAYLFERNHVADRVYIVLEGHVSLLFPLKSAPSIVLDWIRRSSLNASGLFGAEPRRQQGFKLEVETLGSGSVISPIKALVRHENIVDCKAASHVVVLEYSLNKLTALAENLTSLRIQINRTRAQYMYFDRYRNEYISRLMPLDCIKHFQNPLDFPLWRRWTVFREVVLRKIIYQRSKRKIFRLHWGNFIRKVRATIAVEERFPRVAAKIASGEVHPDIEKSLDFVGARESDNPLILQFAIEMMHMTKAANREDKHVQQIKDNCLTNASLIKEIQKDISILRELSNLYMAYTSV